MDSFQRWLYSDDHLSKMPCTRLTTSLLKPWHDNGLLPPSRLYLHHNGLLPPSRLYLHRLAPLVHSQTLPHLPETLLLPRGLKKYKDHRCLVHLLQPNALLKAPHQTNEPVNAPNTTLSPCQGLRRMQAVYPPPHHHNLQGVQHVETSLSTGC